MTLLADYMKAAQDDLTRQFEAAFLRPRNDNHQPIRFGRGGRVMLCGCHERLFLPEILALRCFKRVRRRRRQRLAPRSTPRPSA